MGMARYGMKKPGRSTISAFNCPNCGAAASGDSTRCPYCLSALAVKICAACYGAVSVTMKHCPHCGAEMTNTGGVPAPELRCPRCACPLEARAVGAHTLHACGRCGGMWVDRISFQDICSREEEQEAVLGYAPPEPVVTEGIEGVKGGKPRVYIPCPVCGKLMNHKNFATSSGVVLDWCRDHGSWFDRQELHRIVSFIRGGGMRRARELQKERLKAQEAELRMRQAQSAALSRRLGTDSTGLDQGPSADLLLKFLTRMFR